MIPRLYELGDAPAVGRLHRTSFEELAAAGHTVEQVAAMIRHLASAAYSTELAALELFVWEDDRKIVGTAGWNRHRSSARIRKVYVRPDRAGTGAGRLMVEHVERKAAGAGYEHAVVRANVNAIGFYRALGYSDVEAGVMTVADGVELPTLWMEKALTP